MLKKFLVLVILCLYFDEKFAQAPAQDTLYLMNGHVVSEKVLDTLLGAVTIADPKKISRKIHYEFPQLYMVRYTNGYKRFYYRQDSALFNYFTRDEMWMYMKGEVDARKGFKARGSLIGAGVAGLVGGLTGTFFAPIAPYGFMACVGIPKVRIRHKTVSNPMYLESDPYILGYERVARHKRRIQAVIGGSIGLAIGYSLYALLHQYYPTDIGFFK